MGEEDNFFLDVRQRPVGKILIWGGGSKARIILEMIKERSLGSVGCIFDYTLEKLKFESDVEFLNKYDELVGKIHEFSHFVVCIGNEHGFSRVKTGRHLEELSLSPLEVIHSRAFVEATASLGRGCHVMPGAVIHKFAEVGSYCIVNTNSTVDHECLIGEGVHIMGSAAVAGRVEIGDYVTIGTNATILPDLKIGSGAYVGAGAVVTHDVEPYSVVVGVPARKIKMRNRDAESRQLWRDFNSR